jgi:hypothetical protein
VKLPLGFKRLKWLKHLKTVALNLYLKSYYWNFKETSGAEIHLPFQGFVLKVSKDMGFLLSSLYKLLICYTQTNTQCDEGRIQKA